MAYLIQHAVEHSAEKSPDQDAFRFHGEGVSYSQLNRRANALAAELVKRGVKPQDRVGIFMNKSLHLPVAVYGILKAGAAYVPLDPTSPVGRLDFILRDCGIRFLITQKNKLRVIKQVQNIESRLDGLIGIEEADDLAINTLSWTEIYAAESYRVPTIRLMERDLAYVMYTSGSTGKPKGIMHTHSSGLAYAKLSAALYDVKPGDKLANHSPLHFDMSTFEFFSGPLHGATSVLIPEEYTRLPASLSKLLEDEKMTIWYSVTFALMQLLLRGVMEDRDLTSLRWVLFGGEPFPVKYLRELMQQLPNARFSNVYGPAEVNQCTFYHLPEVPDENMTSVPLGEIWDNTSGLIVDENDNEIETTEPGELLIRSATMMRGYWGRPDLNESAFYIREPFADYKEVFYRTGDLVQRAEDGNLLFLGRKDRQIKTRGYRVELDDVESALLSHLAIEEAAVYPVPDEEGTQFIEAGVTLKAEQDTTVQELIVYLKSKLPHYAIPRKLQIMDEFPRTGTGKIDRRTLREAAIAGSKLN